MLPFGSALLSRRSRRHLRQSPDRDGRKSTHIDTTFMGLTPYDDVTANRKLQARASPRPPLFRRSPSRVRRTGSRAFEDEVGRPFEKGVVERPAEHEQVEVERARNHFQKEIGVDARGQFAAFDGAGEDRSGRAEPRGPELVEEFVQLGAVNANVRTIGGAIGAAVAGSVITARAQPSGRRTSPATRTPSCFLPEFPRRPSRRRSPCRADGAASSPAAGRFRTPRTDRFRLMMEGSETGPSPDGCPARSGLPAVESGGRAHRPVRGPATIRSAVRPTFTGMVTDRAFRPVSPAACSSGPRRSAR